MDFFGNNIYNTAQVSTVGPILHRLDKLMSWPNACHSLRDMDGEEKESIPITQLSVQSKKDAYRHHNPQRKKYNKNRKRPKFPCINYYTSWSSLRLIKLC